MISSIIVRFQVEGFHKWDGAPEHRQYLANVHRHQFHVEAAIQVFADDREIEFHDFLQYCKSQFPGGSFGGMSCEMMARELLTKITDQFPKRIIRVDVFEDDEVGASVRSGEGV